MRGVCIGWHDTWCANQTNEGGLGIKKIELFNIALLSTWKWRFLVDVNASWHEILSYIYGDISFILFNGTTQLGGKKDSLWWRDLISVGNDLISAGGFEVCLRHGLGSGKEVICWHHHWLVHQPLYLVFPQLYAGIS